MAKIYAKRIQNNQMTIDDVPAKWREQTRQLLTKPN